MQSFSICLPAVSITFGSSSMPSVCINSSLLFMEGQYSIMCVDHRVFIDSPADGHL